MEFGHGTTEQGATGAQMPGLCALPTRLYCISVTSSHLFHTKMCAVEGKRKAAPFASRKLLVSHTWDLLMLGRWWGEEMSSEEFRWRVRPMEICFASASLAWLIWALWGFVTQWKVVWELEALQVSLVRKSCCGCISKLRVTWGPTRVIHAQLDLHELMSYFATFKSHEHHILQKKTREVVMG